MTTSKSQEDLSLEALRNKVDAARRDARDEMRAAGIESRPAVTASGEMRIKAENCGGIDDQVAAEMDPQGRVRIANCGG